MGKMKKQVITPEQSRDARDALGLSQSAAAKGADIARPMLSMFESGRDARPPTSFLKKLRAFYEVEAKKQGVELSFDSGSAPPQPAPAKQRGRAIPRPAFVIPDETISDKLPADTVDAIADRLDNNARSVAHIVQQPVDYDLFNDLSSNAKDLHATLVKLLAEEALLRRRLEGRCIVPPLPPQLAEDGARMNTHGQLLAKNYEHLNQEPLAVEKPADIPANVATKRGWLAGFFDAPAGDPEQAPDNEADHVHGDEDDPDTAANRDDDGLLKL